MALLSIFIHLFLLAWLLWMELLPIYKYYSSYYFNYSSKCYILSITFLSITFCLENTNSLRVTGFSFIRKRIGYYFSIISIFLFYNSFIELSQYTNLPTNLKTMSIFHVSSYSSYKIFFFIYNFLKFIN